MKLHFLGANRQVTGSRYVVECDSRRIMVDCGLFQERPYLDRNWAPPPLPPKSIDALLLTHAHLDHCGLLPRLVREGYSGPIYCTPPTRELAEIVLLDAAKVQMEDAAYKRKRHQRENRKGAHPEIPLYTDEDARAVLPLFKEVEYRSPLKLTGGVTAVYHDAGHILGSAFIELQEQSAGTRRSVVFSGDVGQKDKPLICDPEAVAQADYVVMESTYGDRRHPDAGTIEDQLSEIIKQTVAAGGNVIIPTFAIERAQELMYYLGRLAAARRIPPVRVFLDSPMAVDVTGVFERYGECVEGDARGPAPAGRGEKLFEGMKLIDTADDSKALNRVQDSCIILAGSGMCNGGRIKHHLANNLERPECTVVFVGYQSVGTLGREILDGSNKVRIHGKQHRVRARIAQVQGLSAHADQEGLLDWIGGLKAAPRKVFLTHGEEQAAQALAAKIHELHGWPASIPEYGEAVELE